MKILRKFSFGEVIEKLKELYEDVDDLAYDHNPKEIIGVGILKEVKQKGGEDQGSEWYSIKHIPEQNIYIKVEGYYTSHHGTDFYDGWDCCKQVNPKEKTIIIYE